jgi:hypothetical protein
MRAKSMSSSSLWLGIVLAMFSVHADPVSISGTVKDQAGKAIRNAVITLKGASMSAISDSTGAYTLTGNASVLRRSANPVPDMRPYFAKKCITFNVTENVARVHIEIIDLRGRLAQAALDRPLTKGSYSVFPAFGLLSHGLYTVSVSIGSTRTFFKLPLVGSRARETVAPENGTDRSASALSKSAAVADSIQVCATGYTTIGQSIDSYTGTYDFVMQPGYTLIYFRLRIEYVNKGDWSGLTVNDTSKVVKVRRMALTGNPMASEANPWHLGLNQSDSTLKAGGSASETVDFALTPDALNAAFQCRLDKGVAGSDTLSFYGVNGATTQLLKTIGLTSGSNISVDLSWLKSCPPVVAPMAPVQKMGLALYYPWYSLSSWTSNELIDHPATLYDSGDTLAIARQMDQAKSAGITGFLESWAGPGSDSDNKLKLLLKVAQQKTFKIGIFFELLGDSSAPRDTNVIFDWLSYMVSTYRDNPALLEVSNKPIAVPFCANYVPCATWKRILAKLHAAGLDAAVIFNQDPGDSLFVFDGVCCSPSNSLGRAVRYYSVLADSPAAKIYIATAMPGFDERLIPGRTGRYTDRQNGQYFTTQLSAAVGSNPDWLEAYTWNEWWENTYIEPSVNYGDQYLQIFGSFCKPWLAQ